MKNFNKKPTLKSNSVYLQIGLIVALVLALFFIEHTTEIKSYKAQKVDDDVFQLEENFSQTVVIEKEKKVKKAKVKLPETPSLPTEPNDNLNEDELFKTSESKKNLEGEITLEDPSDGEIDFEPENNNPVGINFVSEVPVFPGCEIYKTRDEKVNCFSDKIKQLVQRKFDHGLGSELGLHGEQRIYVNFTVNKDGKIIDVVARSKSIQLQKEAVRVAKLLPTMKPGKQNGKSVKVNYSLLIVLNIQ
ncbi:energy transducer TonB [Mesonia aestuariivivens]|uniref:Energy transducer TonB n=1 Tax=Mesonia aestuariivivens TaxID=2796128 RepID=A0ABS6W3L6_9FLAO|nr:energy transducer TonB [Mesonia aestuariivivens]MBW2962442.1 energy transducer TonB [Mesonia aestuariivivens]